MFHFGRARCAVLLSLSGILALSQPDCFAQSQSPVNISNGLVTGIVLDPSGARIPHASLTIHSDTFDHSISADSEGRFSLSLPIGSYQLTVTARGFAPFTVSITVDPRSPLRLELPLTIAARAEEVAVPIDGNLTTSASDNASAITFSSAQLSTFSDDDATFQKELQALAGGNAGKPADVYVDGFSGGRIPPKSSILSVRINRNPYSAAYDSLGFGRIEISTRPGGEKLHGHISLNATDNAFNAQNPYFTTVEPPYYILNLDANLSGSIDRKTAFNLTAVYNDQQNNAALNAETLDTNLQPIAYSQAVADPQLTSTFGLRLDRRLSATHTLTGRYEFNQINLTNGGLTAPLTLATQAFNNGTTSQTLQLSDNKVFGAHVVLESRAQYLRSRLQQNAISNMPTLVIEGGFSGGGNTAQSLRDNQDHFEFQQLLSVDHGVHYLRFGARYRLLRDANLSTANYNGQWTFPSLGAYAANQPSLFSITTGQSSATILTGDLGAYAEDEWKVTPNITLDLGFRLESQSAIPDHLDPAPRAAIAWALHRKKQRAPFVTLRAGGGIFYDRFAAADILTSVRQNGISQQTYTLSNPTTYPQLPNTAILSVSPPTIYRINPNLRSEYGWIGGFSVEKSIARRGTISADYLEIRGVHQWASQNVNAPLPGTYNPANPGSGARPFGGSQNIYEFDSNGIEKMQQFILNSRMVINKHLNVFLSYNVARGRQDVTNAETFVSNSYNVAQDYGRAPQPTQHLFVGGTAQLPFGIAANVFASTAGGTPFNITTGTDLNGDTIFNDRPAFATRPTANSVLYTTRYGTFDANPQPGESIIPINYGNSPNFSYVDLSANRSFHLGPRHALPAAGKPAGRSTPPYTLTFTVDAPNVFNSHNPGMPVGVLSSAYFGQSVSLNNPFTTNTAANRVVFLQAAFSF